MRCSGEGPTPALWFLCGEGPGQQEDRVGLPFQGKTGEELRRYFDGDVLPDFAETFRSNIYREWGGKDYEYTQADFERDEPELLDELREVRPGIIVAIGRHAARYFLGDVSMDECHGLPWNLPEAVAARIHLPTSTIVFPAYHPAAGFRSPELSALVSYDFAQLAMFVKGGVKPRRLYDDPFPTPRYELLTGKEGVCRVLRSL